MYDIILLYHDTRTYYKRYNPLQCTLSHSMCRYKDKGGNAGNLIKKFVALEKCDF